LAPTRCGNGHELTPDNLVPGERGTRWRCRQCGSERAAVWRRRHSTAAWVRSGGYGANLTSSCQCYSVSSQGSAAGAWPWHFSSGTASKRRARQAKIPESSPTTGRLVRPEFDFPPSAGVQDSLRDERRLRARWRQKFRGGPGL